MIYRYSKRARVKIEYLREVIEIRFKSEGTWVLVVG